MSYALYRHLEQRLDRPQVALLLFIDQAPENWPQDILRDECWIWTGSRYKNGSPYFTFQGTNRPDVPRYLASFHKKPDLELDFVRTCDNSRCVNPAHYKSQPYASPSPAIQMLIAHLTPLYTSHDHFTHLKQISPYIPLYMSRKDIPLAIRHAFPKWGWLL